MKYSSYALLIVFLLVISCSKELKQEQQTSVVDEHTSRISVDWEGTYTGILPCADCAGIETTLQLSYDNQFVLKEVYKDKNDEPFIEKGVFEWDDSGSNITLIIEGADVKYHQYKVGENKLFKLNSDGNIIKGELEEFYILNKELL